MTESDTAPATDRDLLRAFADRRDEAAFAALVGRHGPVVYGVCRRVLGNAHDADDAFQATFLVLARKPGGVGRPEQLGGWLYAVAVRCARRAKARATARQARQRPLEEVPAPPPADPDWSDVRPVLDEEIGALPDKLRSALVACELQGLDRAAAATALGVPEGTVSSRLARAKEALRGRLARRGLALTAVGIGIVLSKAAPAAVPSGLAAVTAAGGSAAAVGLANAEVIAMFWVKAAKIGLAAVVVAAGVGGMVGYQQAAAAEDKKSDKDKLQGDWKVVSIMVGGKDHPNKDQVGDTMVFKGDKLTLTPFEAEIKLDPAKDPKHVEFKILEGPDNDKGKTCLGIYKLELDGDRLVIHSSAPDGERPTKFESNAGETSVLFVLERVKK